MPDRMQTVLKWFYRLLWLIVGGGACAAGYGVSCAMAVATAPEAYGSPDNLEWIAKLIGGGGLSAGLAAGVRWLVGMVWGKVARGKTQPFAQYVAATGAVDVLTRYLGNHPAAAGLTPIGEACGEVFMAALKTAPPAVETK